MSNVEIWDEVFSALDPNDVDIYSAYAADVADVFRNAVAQGATLLEVGSGAGELSGRLVRDGYRCTLLDQSNAALAVSRQVFDLHGLQGSFQSGDMYNLPFDDDSFDCVWNSGVLEHYSAEEIVAALREMARVSRDYVIVMVPNAQNLVYRMAKRLMESSGEWSFGVEHPQLSMRAYYERAGIQCFNERFLAHDLTTHWTMKLGVNDAEKLRIFNDEIREAALLAPNTTGYILATVGRKHMIVPDDRTVQPTEKAIPINLLMVLEQRHREINHGLKELGQGLVAELGFLREEVRETRAGARQAHERESELTKEIIKLRQEAGRDKTLVDELETQLRAAEDKAADLSSRVDFEYIQRKTFQRELTRIQNSKTYKAMTPLWLLKRKLFGSKPMVREQESIETAREVSPVASKPKLVPDGRRVFVRFGVIDWDFRFQRPQQILKALVSHGAVGFYVNVSFTRGDSIIQEIQPDLFQITLGLPWSINVYREKPTNAQAKEMHEELLRVLDEHGVRTGCVIVDLPFWYSVADSISRTLGWPMVYDMMDDHAGFKNNHSSMIELEEKLISKSDGIICSSQKLWEKIKDASENAVLVRNACEFDHFQKALTPLSERDGTPVVGYYGAISEWFDPFVLEPLVSAHPDWDFILAGAVTDESVRRQLAYPNVQWLGEVAYRDLPGVLRQFDLCIIPFKIYDLTLATNPVKVYEYLAAGKPVVATAMPEVKRVAEEDSELVSIAESPGQFKDISERLVSHRSSDEVLSKRMEYARVNDWAFRATDVERFVDGLYRMASIIVVSYGNLSLTKQCLESIFRFTDYPSYEVVVVDNGSSEDTVRGLQQLEDQYPFTLILLGENKGFAAANNVGMAEARGEYLVLLNNDTIVTFGWLTSLVKVLGDDSVGIACPCTNSIGNEAQIPVSYESLSDDLQGFAHDRYLAHRGEYFDIPMVPLFCAAIRKALYCELGGLDEDYQEGMFEDDDFSRKVIDIGGLRTVCSDEAFVHHFGRAAFSKLDEQKYKDIFDRNRATFERKWGRKWVPHSYRQ